jgi:hypothetical protein
MRPSRFAALLSLCCVFLAFGALGCQKTASERVLGKWHGVKADGVVADVQPAANEAANGMELEFKKDVVVIRPAKDKDPLTARYIVLREDRRSVVVVTEHDGARDEQTLTLDDDDTMRWQVLQGKTITFEREKEKNEKAEKAKAGGASSSASAP